MAASVDLGGDPSSCAVPIDMVDFRGVLAEFEYVDLLHINCEGCEAPVLKTFLSASSTANVAAVEVQYHKVHVPLRVYCEIESSMRAHGYTLAYRYPYVWELWVREVSGRNDG